jgi:type IV secretion system protein VirB4
VAKGAPFKLRNPLSNLFSGQTQKKHRQYIEKTYQQLNKTTDKIVDYLSVFSPKKLGLVTILDNVYSEITTFLNKLVNLSDSLQPLSQHDISKSLASNAIAFGFNELEITGSGTKKFGGILQTKGYNKLPEEALNKLLMLPHNLIITQVLNFISQKSAAQYYHNQHYLLQISNSEKLIKEFDIDGIIEREDTLPTSFCNVQTTVTVSADSKTDLNWAISNVVSALLEIGIVTYRTDIKLEQIYWSQLPGNYQFICNVTPVKIENSGQFLILSETGFSSKESEHALSIKFKDNADALYSFKLEAANNEHLMIIGKHTSYLNAITNLIVSQTNKAKIVYIDHQRSANILIKALGGDYFIIDPENNTQGLKLNPLKINDNDFLKKFLKFLLIANKRTNKQNISKIEQMAEKISKEKMHQISKLKEYTQNIEIKTEYEKFLAIFSDQEDNFPSSQVFGIDISKISAIPGLLLPIMHYIMHMIETSNDNKIVVINLPLQQILQVRSNLKNWLQQMQARNSIVIFVDEAPQSSAAQLLPSIPNKIFLPDLESSKTYKYCNIPEKEVGLLRDKSGGYFVLQQQDNFSTIQCNLEKIKAKHILSGETSKIKIMEEVISELGDDPKKWLPTFYEKVNHN